MDSPDRNLQRMTLDCNETVVMVSNSSALARYSNMIWEI